MAWKDLTDEEKKKRLYVLNNNLLLQYRQSAAPADSGSSGQSAPASSGEGSFVMSDIVGEGTISLYYEYDIPARLNCPLLVLVHAWSGGGKGFTDQSVVNALMADGFAVLSVGMRGRNTGVGFSNDGGDVTKYRDASALECYDIYATVQHFIDSVAPAGQIDSTKKVLYGISGGGGNAWGMAAKFPGYFSTIVVFYGMSKYGTYNGDPNSSITGWYTDDVNFQGSINVAVGGAPGDSATVDTYYLSRDHARGVANTTARLFFYHSPADTTVKKEQSDLVQTVLLAAGKAIGVDFDYYIGTSYNHGQHALDPAFYDGVFGMEWRSTALSRTVQALPNSATKHIAGYLYLRAGTFVWLKTSRGNTSAPPTAPAPRNQGKAYAATLIYNLSSETYQITPIMPAAANQFYYVEVIDGSKYIMGVTAASDVITWKPKNLNKKPLNLNYAWSVYYDFADTTDGYFLDDASKIAVINDLTGNNKFAFNRTRASRIAPGANLYLDNGVYYLGEASGDLAATGAELTGAFSIFFSIDPDAASVASLNDAVLGRMTGAASLIRLSTFSGKVQLEFQTNSTNFISNATPSNSNVGKQVWCVRRDSGNVVTATCVNSSGTFNYTIGTSAGIFEIRAIGTGTATTKQFAGKIYKVAAATERIGDTDVASILTNWFNN